MKYLLFMCYIMLTAICGHIGFTSDICTVFLYIAGAIAYLTEVLFEKK